MSEQPGNEVCPKCGHARYWHGSRACSWRGDSTRSDAGCGCRHFAAAVPEAQDGRESVAIAKAARDLAMSSVMSYPDALELIRGAISASAAVREGERERLAHACTVNDHDAQHWFDRYQDVSKDYWRMLQRAYGRALYLLEAAMNHEPCWLCQRTLGHDGWCQPARAALARLAAAAPEGTEQ